MRDNLIYGLTDPRTGEIRYIGKTKYGLRRFREHAKDCARGRTYKTNWIRQLQSLGLQYGFIVLEEVDSADGLSAAEIGWIAFGRAYGWRLTNATGGGEGMKNPTPEYRARLSEIAKRRCKEKPLSPESREKQAAKLRGRPWGRHTPESKLKMRLAKLGRKFTAEHRANMRAAHLGKRRGPYKKRGEAVLIPTTAVVMSPIADLPVLAVPVGEVLH